jgi:hypothetical protein
MTIAVSIIAALDKEKNPVIEKKKSAITIVGNCDAA